MQYWIIAIAMIGMIAVYIFIRKKNNNGDFKSTEFLPVRRTTFVNPRSKFKVSEIKMEKLPSDTDIDEGALSEITDKKVLARIDNLIPGLAQASVSTANGLKMGTETVYRAIIPAGTQLTNSKAMKGAVRGFYHGMNGIQGHANLVAVDQTAASVANSAVAAMSVAAMVVGQYYMTQINSELNKINDEIERITDFQDYEFRSRVFALITQVKKISTFQVEILENDELRTSELSHLDKLEDECIQLLGQANLTIAGYAGKNGLEYAVYEKELHKAQEWYAYQQSLLEVLYQIADLKYALHFGNVTKAQCSALLPTYRKQVADAQELLSDWHKSNMERLGIDIADFKRKRQGIDGIVHWLPGLVDDTQNYRPITESTVEMIEQQSSAQQLIHICDEGLYNTDIQIISKEGKVFYLPNPSEHQK